MAKTGAVWGIDIGQCALKALRCRPHESDPEMITAEDFEYIEYPKILSQPDADAEELVRDALREFLSRHDLSGDRVAISVSGQSGLARFIKLPPVESKKIPDIVKYEARQQIPFALEDVVWDYQQMAGGSVEEGFALETEVGLFAMKRDQVYRSLQPLTDAGIAVDLVQLTPLAIYNFVAFDLLSDLPPADEYDPDSPPPSTVAISLGTDTTDLVVTNGYRVWQRSVPIGGNHFTRALTKELRLTFAKAERLKRNATKAENPKAVFKAMRPVFSDLVTEIDRSIGYFSGIDRTANIGNVMAMGNALKLPGLRRYLSENLKREVHSTTSFRGLAGDEVLNAPAFKDNLLSFCVSYGLCLQGLGKAKIVTNLLPQEIVTERLVREKKPWVVAGVAAVMAGCVISFYGYFAAYQSVDNSRPEIKRAIATAQEVGRVSSGYKTTYDGALQNFEAINTIGKHLVSNVEGRLLWLELIKAVVASLPHDPPDQQKPEQIADRYELHIESMDCEYFEDLSTWFEPWKEKYLTDYQSIYGHAPGQAPAAAETTPGEKPPADASGQPPAADAAAPAVADTTAIDTGDTGESDDAGPSGPGYVIQLQGYHYHNADSAMEREKGPSFVRNTLLKNLMDGTVRLPDGLNGDVVDVPIKDLGIGYPILVSFRRTSDPQPLFDPTEGSGYGQRLGRSGEGDDGPMPRPRAATTATAAAGEEEKPEEPKVQMVRRTPFIVQFCWTQTPPTGRQLIAQQRADAANAAAEAAAADGKTAQVTTNQPPAGE
jgi:type IV pilus assembly protein PilM